MTDSTHNRLVDRLVDAQELLSSLLRRVNQSVEVMSGAMRADGPSAEDRLDTIKDALTILMEDLERISSEAIEAHLIDLHSRPLPVGSPGAA